MIKATITVITGLLIVAGGALAEEKEKSDKSSVVVEFGGGGEWDVHGGAGAYGPYLALEYEVIEHWLEIETAVAPRFSNGQAEVEFELIFKKPFELSKSLEFLIGAGPVWVHRTEESPKASIAGEAIVELVYWPWDDHKVGFFVSPATPTILAKGTSRRSV